MGKDLFYFGMTPEDYNAFVEKHGHSPTQDPMYNHEAGHSEHQASAVQPSFSPLDRNLSTYDSSSFILKGMVEDGRIEDARAFVALIAEAHDEALRQQS